MLRLEGVGASYGAAVVLEDVTLEVAAGEFVLLIGLNGAGKTTLLKTIMGVHPLGSGDICLDGESIAKLPTERRHRRGIAWIPEGRGVVKELTVRENLDLARFSAGWTPEARERSLEQFPILERAYHRSGSELSGGEQQMLALARALETGSRLLLVDEPSLGLAPVIVHQVFERLTALKEEGLSVLLVEQRAAEVGHAADRTLAIKDGRVSTAVGTGEAEFADIVGGA
jgi:branched-chain amino acid transport system ATP-binding protein